MPNPKPTTLADIINAPITTVTPSNPNESVIGGISSNDSTSPISGNSTGFSATPIVREKDWSQYDENYIPGVQEVPSYDAEDEHRAQTQSNWKRVADVIPRLGLTAATKLASSIGYLGATIGYGITDALPGSGKNFSDFVKDVSDNGWTKVTDQAEATVKNDWFPIYKTQAFLNGNLGDQLTSASFYTDNAVDLVAFMGAMYGPSMIGAGLGLGKGVANLLAGGADAAKVMEEANAAGKIIGGTGDVISNAERGITGSLGVGLPLNSDGTIAAIDGTYAASSLSNQVDASLMQGAKLTKGGIFGTKVMPGTAANAIDQGTATLLSTQSMAMMMAKDTREQGLTYWKSQINPTTNMPYTGDEPEIKKMIGNASVNSYLANFTSMVFTHWIEAGAMLTPFNTAQKSFTKFIEDGAIKVPEHLTRDIFTKTLGKNVVSQAIGMNVMTSIGQAVGKQAEGKTKDTDFLNTWRDIINNVGDNMSDKEGIKTMFSGIFMGLLSGGFAARGEAAHTAEHLDVLSKSLIDAAKIGTFTRNDFFEHEIGEDGTSHIKLDDTGKPVYNIENLTTVAQNMAGVVYRNVNDEHVAASQKDASLYYRVMNTRLANLIIPKLNFTDSKEVIDAQIDDYIDKVKSNPDPNFPKEDWIGDTKITIDQQGEILKQHARQYQEIMNKVLNHDIFINDGIFKLDKTGTAKEIATKAMYGYLTDNYNIGIDNINLNRELMKYDLNDISTARDVTKSYTRINEIKDLLKNSELSSDERTTLIKENNDLVKPIHDIGDSKINDIKQIRYLDARLADNAELLKQNSDDYHGLNSPELLKKSIEIRNDLRDKVVKAYADAAEKTKSDEFKQYLTTNKIKKITPDITKKYGKVKDFDQIVKDHLANVDATDVADTATTTNTITKNDEAIAKNAEIENHFNAIIGESGFKHEPIDVTPEEKVKFDENPIIKALKEDDYPDNVDDIKTIDNPKEKQYVINKVLESVGHTGKQDVPIPIKDSKVIVDAKDKGTPITTDQTQKVTRLQGILDAIPHAAVGKEFKSTDNIPVKLRTDVVIATGKDDITKDNITSDHIATANSLKDLISEKRSLVDYIIAKHSNITDPYKRFEAVMKELRGTRDNPNLEWHPMLDKIAINRFLLNVGFDEAPIIDDGIPKEEFVEEPTNIDIQKQDIERRRQAELNRYFFEDNSPSIIKKLIKDRVDSTINVNVNRQGNTFNVIINDKKINVSSKDDIKKIILNINSNANNITVGGYKLDQDVEINRNIVFEIPNIKQEINAKYDAELAKLNEVKPTETETQGDENSDGNPSVEPKVISDISDEEMLHYNNTSEIDRGSLDAIINKKLNNEQLGSNEEILATKFNTYITNGIKTSQGAPLDSDKDITNQTSDPHPDTNANLLLGPFNPKINPGGQSKNAWGDTIYDDATAEAYKLLQTVKPGDVLEVKVGSLSEGKTYKGEDPNNENLPIDILVQGVPIMSLNENAHLVKEVKLTSDILNIANDQTNPDNALRKLEEARRQLNNIFSKPNITKYEDDIRTIVETLLGKGYINESDAIGRNMVIVMGENIKNKLNYGSKPDIAKGLNDYKQHLNDYNKRIGTDLEFTEGVRNAVHDAWVKDPNAPITVKVKVNSLTSMAYNTKFGHERSLGETFGSSFDPNTAELLVPNDFATAWKNAPEGLETTPPANAMDFRYIDRSHFNTDPKTGKKVPFAVGLRSRKLNEDEVQNTYDALTTVFKHMQTHTTDQTGRPIFNTIKKSDVPQEIEDALTIVKDHINLTSKPNPSSYDMKLGPRISEDEMPDGRYKYSSVGKIKIDGDEYEIFLTNKTASDAVRGTVKTDKEGNPEGKFSLVREGRPDEVDTHGNQRKQVLITDPNAIKKLLLNLDHNVNTRSLESNPEYKARLLKDVFTSNAFNVRDKDNNILGVAQPYGIGNTMNGIVNVSPHIEDLAIPTEKAITIDTLDKQVTDHYTKFIDDGDKEAKLDSIFANTVGKLRIPEINGKQYRFVRNDETSVNVEVFDGTNWVADNDTSPEHHDELKATIGFKEAGAAFRTETKDIIDTYKSKDELALNSIRSLLDTSTGVELRREWSLGLRDEKAIDDVDKEDMIFYNDETKQWDTNLYGKDEDGDFVSTNITSNTKEDLINQVNDYYNNLSKEFDNSRSINLKTAADEVQVQAEAVKAKEIADAIDSNVPIVEGATPSAIVTELPNVTDNLTTSDQVATDTSVPTKKQIVDPTNINDLDFRTFDKYDPAKDYGKDEPYPISTPETVIANWTKIFGNAESLIVDSNPIIWNDQAVHGIFHSAVGILADTRLASNAEIGSEYHEAMHRILELFLPERRRAKVYAEVKDEFTLATDKQANEKLSELFRQYKITQGLNANSEYSIFGMKLPTEVSKLFNQLLTYINEMLGRRPEINKLFTDIEKGKFRNKQPIRSTEVLSNIIPGFTSLSQTEAVGSTVGLIEGLYLNYTNSGIVNFINDGANIKEAVTNVYKKVVSRKQTEIDDLKHMIKSTKDASLKDISKKQLEIATRIHTGLTSILDDLQTNDTKNSIFTIASNKFADLNYVKVKDIDQDINRSVNEYVNDFVDDNVDEGQRNTKLFDDESQNTKTGEREFSSITRIIIHRLQDVEYDSLGDKGYNTRRLYYESTGLKQYVDYRKYVNKLHDLTSNSTSVDSMMEKIKNASKVIPALAELYDTLSKNPSYKNSFYSDFNRHTVSEYATKIEQGDELSVKQELLNKPTYQLLANKWADDIKANEHNEIFSTHFGIFVPENKKTSTEKIDPRTDMSFEGNRLLNEIKTERSKTDYNFRDVLDKITNVYNMLGVNVDANDLNIFLNNDTIQVSDNATPTIKEKLIQLENKAIAIRNSMLGTDNNGKPDFANYSDLNWISRVVAIHRLNATENTYRTVSGDRKYQYGLPNYLSNLNTLIKVDARDETGVKTRDAYLSTLMLDRAMSETDPINPTKQDGTPNRIIYSNWFRPGGQLDLNTDAGRNLFEISKDGGILNTSNYDSVPYNKMSNTEWYGSVLSKYLVPMRSDRGKNVVRIPLQVASDSTTGIVITINKIKLNALEVTNFDKNNFSILHSSNLHRSLWNVVRQEESRMRQARELLFDYIGGKFVPKTKEKYKVELLEDYHYKGIDKDGNPILMDKNGKATGNVFKFSDFSGLNDDTVNVRNEQGILRIIAKDGKALDILDAYRERVDNVIDTWIKGEVSDLHDKMSGTLTDPSLPFFDYAKKVNEDINNRTTHTIAEYAINRKIAQVEAQNMIFGKTAEFSSEANTNKRAKGPVSNGVSSFSEGVYRSKVLSDIILSSEYMDQLRNAVKNNLIKDFNYKEGTDLDKRIESIVGGYGKLNTTDGQGLGTPSRLVAILKSRNMFDVFANQFEFKTNPDGSEYRNKLGNQVYQFKPNMSLNDIEAVTRVTKGFFYDRAFDEDLQMLTTKMRKYATETLNNNMIKGTELESLLAHMDENGDDEYVFASSDKAGNKVPANIHNSDGSLKEDFISKLDNYPTEQLDASRWINQQDVSDATMDHNNKRGIQIEINMTSNIHADTEYELESDFKLNGQPIKFKGDEIFDHIQHLMSGNLIDSYTKLAEELKLNSEDTAEMNQALSKFLISGLGSSMNTVDDINSLKINPITKDFNKPLDSSNWLYKIQTLIASKYTSDVIDQKFPGGHLVSVSDAFSGKPKYVGQTAEDAKSGKLDMEFSKDGSIMYVDCKMPPYSKEFFNTKGELDVDLNNVPDFLKEVIAYRIPNSGKALSVVLRVKEFLPTGTGPTIMVAKEMLQRMGTDFDVDSLFLMAPKFVKSETFDTNYQNRQVRYNIPDRNDVESGKLTNTDLRNNHLLAAYKAILRNPAHNVETIAGAVYDSVETIRDTINSELKLNTKTIDVTSASGQDNFRETANVGKNLISIFAASGSAFIKYQKVGAQLNERNIIDIKYDANDLHIVDGNKGERLADLRAKYGKVIDNKDGTYTISHRNIAWNFDGSYVNIDGELITDEVGKILNNAADNVKKNLPRNYNETTANAISGMQALGIPLPMISRLVNQEGIDMYVKKQNEDNVFKSGASYFALSSTLDDLFVKLHQANVTKKVRDGIPLSPTDIQYNNSIAKSGRIYYTVDTKDTLYDYLGIPKDIPIFKDGKIVGVTKAINPVLNSGLKKGLEYKGRRDSNTRLDSDLDNENIYWKQQIRTVRWYDDINTRLTDISRTNPAMNVDKLRLESIGNAQKILDSIQDVSGGLVINHNESLMEHVYPSQFGLERAPIYPVLETYLQNGAESLVNNFSSKFITEYPSYNALRNQFKNTLNYVDNSVLQGLDKHMTYAISSLVYSKSNVLDISYRDQQELFGIIGENSLSKRVSDAKLAIKVEPTDAHVLNYIRFATDDVAVKRNGYIKTYTLDTNNEPNVENGIKDSMTEMYFNPKTITPEHEVDGRIVKAYTTKDLVTDMVKTNFIESKFAFGTNSTANLIPNDVIADLGINDTWNTQKIHAIQNAIESGDAQHYINNFILSNWNNKKIAPIVHTKVMYGTDNRPRLNDDESLMTKDNTPVWVYSKLKDEQSNTMTVSMFSLKREPLNIQKAKFIKIRVPKREMTDTYEGNRFKLFYRVDDIGTGRDAQAKYVEVKPMSLIDLPGNRESLLPSNNSDALSLTEVQKQVNNERMAAMKKATVTTTNTSNIRFKEEQSSGYRERTIKNASADATIAIAVDFNSAGEKLTKSSVQSQMKQYIPINVSTSLEVTPLQVTLIVRDLNSIAFNPFDNTGLSINIAGNGIYTMKGKYIQEQVDKYVYDLLKAVTESPNLTNKITSIRTGGQTGLDEAGAKAGRELGIPTTILAPKNWTFRDINGNDISNEKAFKSRFGDIKDTQLDLFNDERTNSTDNENKTNIDNCL